MIGTVRRLLFTKRPSRWNSWVSSFTAIFGCLVFCVGCDSGILAGGIAGAILTEPVIVAGCTTIDGVEYCTSVDCVPVQCESSDCDPIACTPVECERIACSPVDCIVMDCASVVVCHNGRTITSTPGHLQHGDVIGECQ